jgi:peptide/nickel transport system substrate-binding protein
MQRRTFLTTALAAPLARPALAQSSRARTLRFMPQAALANLDPIFSPSTSAPPATRHHTTASGANP